ncbi:MAG: hypothetical protein FJW20_26285 [Acidimicrobiia bacterium]|nr:hypothetical protein [Acidimicrobiia bacterium]
MIRLLHLSTAIALASVILLQSRPDEPKLPGDPANPYRWADLAESGLEAGGIEHAEALIQYAVSLAPRVPPILMRATNLFFRTGNSDQVLHYSLRTLDLVPDYDHILFRYLDYFSLFPIDRLNGRALASCLKYQITQSNTPRVMEVWDLLKQKKLQTKDMAADVASHLASRASYRPAASAWREFNCAQSPGDCSGDPFNPGFESPPSAVPFDWTVPPPASISGSSPRSGRRSLYISFDGTSNLDWAGPQQNIVVDLPGKYQVSWYMKTAALTTNEGIRLRVFDAHLPARLDRSTEPVTGSTQWTHYSLRFTVNHGTQAVVLQFRRNSSAKLDNRIKGEAWIDDVRIEPVPPD